jgi:hypothetical protein
MVKVFIKLNMLTILIVLAISHVQTYLATSSELQTSVGVGFPFHYYFFNLGKYLHGGNIKHLIYDYFITLFGCYVLYFVWGFLKTRIDRQ